MFYVYLYSECPNQNKECANQLSYLKKVEFEYIHIITNYNYKLTC